MNMARRQAAADPQTRPNDLGCKCLGQLTAVITVIFHYYTVNMHDVSNRNREGVLQRISEMSENFTVPGEWSLRI